MNAPPTHRSLPRILIVEDQYFVALDCELNLRAAGYDCVGCANTAATAMELAERERPDLLIMDVHLASAPDGVQAAIAIYERLGLRCIFASAQADATMRKQAERACPFGWLDKPYTPEQLLEAVSQAVAQLDAAPRIDSQGSTAQAMH
jgi:two-component system, response regulator PdtaR